MLNNAYVLTFVLYKYLVDKGMIEKSARYSHGTALFLWDLTDKTPNKYHMTFPMNYNLTKPKKENIQCTQCKETLYDLGIVDATTPGGNKVKAYSIERTLCDILRSHSQMDIQIVANAYKFYVTRTEKNIPALSEYAKIFKVEARLRAYLEVLL